MNTQQTQTLTGIGIMQGRLVPRYKNRYQAFPVDYWSAEFFIAKEIGLRYVEFILDHETAEKNPLMSEAGLKQIQDAIGESGGRVKTICADYFMARPFHSAHTDESEQVLKILIENSSRLGVRDIVIPCVDQSSMKTEDDQKRVVDSISKHLALADKHGVLINFETDLNPQAFKSFLARFGSANVKVNYEVGNSGSLGYSPTEECAAYGEKISDLHVKDRVLGGSSVMLGTGNANFDEVFGLLKKVNFRGHITMQASRAQDYIEDLARVKEQLAFTNKYVEKYLGETK